MNYFPGRGHEVKLLQRFRKSKDRLNLFRNVENGRLSAHRPSAPCSCPFLPHRVAAAGLIAALGRPLTSVASTIDPPTRYKLEPGITASRWPSAPRSGEIPAWCRSRSFETAAWSPRPQIEISCTSSKLRFRFRSRWNMMTCEMLHG